MPCTNCMAPFTQFRKEHGCSNCSFSFCAKCLSRKVVLPQLSRQPVSVCQNCYDKLHQRTSQRSGAASAPRNGPLYQGDPSSASSSVNYRQSPIYARHCRVDAPPETQRSTPRGQFSAEDEQIRNRLDKLKENDNQQNVLSVGDIEERLAKLRGVSVEEIRNPSLLVVRNRRDMPKETVENLMEKAKAEALIEKKYDPVRQLQQRYNQYHGIEEQEDEEEMEIPAGKLGQSQGAACGDDDILLSEDTVRNMQDLKNTLARAQATSDEASASFADESKMRDEMKEILKITRQKSLKNEKINAEMEKFWKRSMEKYGGDESDSGGEDAANEVDEGELKKILQEAEQAVNEEKAAVKESKKQQKKGFFSKFFRSTDT